MFTVTRSTLSLCAEKHPRRIKAVDRADVSRRVPLLVALGSAFVDPAFAAKLPKGFTVIQDRNDGYQYLAPFGWQEMEIEGQDSVYKDLIEPLESVSVTLIPTEKKSIEEFGPVDQVVSNLADKVLTPPNQPVKILSTSERTIEGIPYYAFEFQTQAGNYTRHALGVVAVGNGKFYALTTGAGERRWSKMEERLRTVIKSFQIIEPISV